MSASNLTFRVARKEAEAVYICAFELVDFEGCTLPLFSAGSHIEVHLCDKLTRQCSLCNNPAENHRYLIGVLLGPASRGGSRTMREIVNSSHVLQISAPKNHFPFAHAARRCVLLAGGIGITPVLCMLERLAYLGGDFELHYCIRSRERTAFHERITASSFGDRSRSHFDDGPVAQRLNISGLLAYPERGVHLYVCGPRGFMDAVLGRARAIGWPGKQLHYEFFTGDVVHSADYASFEVKLASSVEVVDIPADKSVVEALAEAGIEIPTSCEQGVCGTCLTRDLVGDLDHRDMILTPEERAANDQFTPCCPRSKSPLLVLDL
jgi:vanillate O-demethylase ferredoxin subunit